MGKSAVRHLSVRVPWHDGGWDGTLCKDPRANTACLALNLIAEKRDDAFEAEHAGRTFEELGPDAPLPCLRERSTFLSERAHALPVVMPYSRWSDAHRHIKPTIVHVPARGGVIVPYRWMLKEYAWEAAEDYGLDVSESREPTSPEFMANTAWVQDCDNQAALLDGFADLLSTESSLVFFYAKQTPLSDGGAALIGAGRLVHKGKVREYPYEGGKAAGRIRTMVWERDFQHSVAPDPDNEGAYVGGVILPYQRILALAAERDDIAAEDYLAAVPADVRGQFLYGSEHVTHGGAIAALLSLRQAVERTAEILDGPWRSYIDWIDTQLNALWKMHGLAPGLGSALSCVDPAGFNGALFAHALSSEIEDDEDPWPAVTAIFEEKRQPPAGAPKLTSMQRKRFAHLKAKDPDRYELMQLLSRFELAKAQASEVFGSENPAAFLENPYLLFEQTRGTSAPIGITVVDRGIYPAEGAKAAPLPGRCRVSRDEPDDALRLRALSVHILDQAAQAGDTLLTSGRLAAAAAELPVSRPPTIDDVTLELCTDDFAPTVVVTGSAGNLTAQLDTYCTTGRIIRDHVASRLTTSSDAPAIDWKVLVSEAFQAPAEGDTDEVEAQAEKVRALEILETSRIAVLTGPAGSGKTTLLRLLLDRKEVVGRDVLLLAPTGKARVRLGQQTKRPEAAKTIAQFLLKLGRYDPDTGAYVPRETGDTALVSTCVVDEASMLTEDQLAALMSAIPKSARLILVGDPQQLPPIGAGRPFVDLIAHLRAEHKGSGLAELKVSRRQSGGALVPALSLPDVQLANLFSGRSLEPGEDEVLATLSKAHERLRFVEWDSAASLRDRLIDVLEATLGAQDGDLERRVDLSLGGTEAGERIYFNRGAGAAADNWQILSAHRAMASGSTEINRHLKLTVRQARLELARRQRSYGWRVIEPRGADQITYGDKVICLRNHSRRSYAQGVGKSQGYLANGEVGIVTGGASVQTKPFTTDVEFSSQNGLSYSFWASDFSDEAAPTLELAYAVTVHKAQGSEFGTVILVLPASSRLLSRELVYTALTRQKDKVWVLHQGPFAEYLRLRSDFYSETARRLTNLFAAPCMAEVPPPVQGTRGTVAPAFLEEGLIHRTRRGDLVRSKAELIIADALYEHERDGVLRYSFEKAYTGAEGEHRYPDFTIEHGGEVWLWEHCGMLDRPQYAERWEKKRAWYAANGITEWSPANPKGRLIVTADGGGVGFDSSRVHELIRHLASE